MQGVPVHPAPVKSHLLLVGQAPGPREASFGRPFAWTAGRTLFRWFHESLGVTEEQFRATVYMAAVARCFPGKASGGGDRRPDEGEIERCRVWLGREAALLKPKLVIPVGGLAIEQVLGKKGKLAEVIGQRHHARYLGNEVDIIPLPHPSGASTWHRTEPGVSLLAKALGELRRHPEMVRAFRRPV
jgi:uracil-DNA glycosylase